MDEHMTDIEIGKKRQVWRDSHRFALSFQMVGLVVVLLLVCTVLVQIYASALSTSLRTEALNKGVLLCRNAGELFTERGNLDETAALLGGEAAEQDHAVLYFDRSLNCVDESRSWLTLELSVEDRDVGGLKDCRMNVTREGKPVYELTVSVYAPERGA
jgi:hypothetical protein